MIGRTVVIRRRLFSLGLLASLSCGAAFGDGLDATSMYAIPGTDTVVSWWTQTNDEGVETTYYAVSLEGEEAEQLAEAREVRTDIRLRYATFDPLAFEPAINPALEADADNRLFIVQFHTPTLHGYREALEDAGVKVLKFLPHQSFVVEMDPELRASVEKLGFVRWTGVVHPAYKLDPALISELFPMSGEDAVAGGDVDSSEAGADVLAMDNGRNNGGAVEYSIMMTQRGPVPQDIVANRVTALGGTVHQTIPQGFRIRASLTPAQLQAVLAMNEVLFVDEQGVQENDMSIAREIGGGNYLRDTLGMSGEGVRGEVMDDGVRASHVEFEGEVIVHAQNSGGNSHGTATFGIVFASGVNDVNATGMLPEADGKIISDYDLVLNQSSNRYGLTAELVDPNGPYRAVFQSNSWGNSRTRDYTTISAEMDDILFINDITICQSQSNAGSPDSRPQAWAKNMVSVGGVYHRNTLDKNDDAWSRGGSTGPAADGRIKPDFTHFYDSIYTTSSSCDTCYTSSFGGTSGATPITAGHFGLLYQMWHEGVFPGFGGGADVFDSKAHSATAKALMVNGAAPYSGSDFTRTNQGWGMCDLRYLAENADDMLIIDESDVLSQGQSTSYEIDVEVGAERLRATMVYLDPMGNPGANVHRINNLSLRVTAPDNTVYWGNNGLGSTGNVSTPGGSENNIDTVENVFIDNPTPGTWTVEVMATEINEDGHVETGALDADYALVVSGTTGEGGMFISTSGQCPGNVTLSWQGAPANVQMGLLYSNNIGNGSIPNNRPCAGTPLGLRQQGLQLIRYVNSGPNGSGQLSSQVNGATCFGFLQLVEGQDCTTSNVVQVLP